jgi:hypothetical protein
MPKFMERGNNFMGLNTINILLKADADKLKKPTKTIEVNRLSKQLGGKIEFKLEAINANKYAEIQENSVDVDKSGNVKVDMQKMQTFTILDGVTEPSLKSKELMEHFEVLTPIDLINKLFLPGEITTLFNEINKLNGFSDDDEKVNTIKN